MISARTVLYGANDAAIRPWVGAIAATGATVDLVTDPGAVDLRTDLVVADVTGPNDPILERISTMEAPSSAVVILPTSDLVGAVTALRNPAVHAVLAKEHVSQSVLTGISARLLRGNIFGISKIAPWGVRIYSEVVGSHDDRLQALGTLGRFTASLRLRAKYREAIDIVADELLMNGLYDAPIDAQGRQVFGEVSPGQRGGMRLERPAVMQFASDGGRIFLAVRDSFGSLARDTVLGNLERCARSGDQIDRKAGGAGLGLFLVANHVSEMIFNVLPGVATEVACVVDLKVPRQQLMHLGFYQESVAGAENAGQDQRGVVVATGGPVQARGTSRAVQLTLVVAILLLIVAGLLMVWPTIMAPPKGSLKVRTTPPGATIRVNGVVRGVAEPELVIRDLSLDSPCTVSAVLEGRAEAQETIKLRRDATVDLALSLAPLRGKVRVSSSPQGAQVFVDGKDTGLKTPTLLDDLEPDKEIAIAIKAHGFAPSEGPMKPVASQTLIYHAMLTLAPGFAMLGLTSEPSGARLLVNDVDTGEVTPVPGFVVRGGQRYRIKLVAEGRVPWTHEWEAEAGGRMVKSVTLPQGGRLTLTSNVEATALVGEQEMRLPLRGRVVPAGAVTVRLRGNKPLLDAQLRLSVQAGEHVTRELLFGFVKVDGKKWRIKLPGHRPVPKVALKPGAQEVTLVGKGGESRTVAVDVQPKATVSIDPATLGDAAPAPAPKPKGKGAARKGAAAKRKPATKAPAAKPDEAGEGAKPAKSE